MIQNLAPSLSDAVAAVMAMMQAGALPETAVRLVSMVSGWTQDRIYDRMATEDAECPFE